MDWFYYYELYWYFDTEKKFAKGITYGVSWADAMNHLVEHYGENEISEITHFIPIGNGGNCIEIDEIKDDIDYSKKKLKETEEQNNGN